MDVIGRALHRWAGSNAWWMAALIMMTVSAMSSFVSNTATVAFFLPAVIVVARRIGASPSLLLMPVAFAAILSSSVTLIATSTNIVISGMLSERGMDPIHMFELTPVGLPILLLGLTYMFTIGLKLLPRRAEQETLEDEYRLRDYISEVIVLSGSPLAGKSLRQSGLGTEMDLQVVGMIHGKERVFAPNPNQLIAAGDVLLVEGRAEDILKVKSKAGIEIRPDFKLDRHTLQSGEIRLVEAMVMPDSALRGITLKEMQFRERYGCTVLAINRHGTTLRSKLTDIPLRVGDVLLIQGEHGRIQRVASEGHISLLQELSGTTPRSEKAKYAMVVFLAAILVGTLRIMPFSVAIVGGAVMMFLLRVITPREAYNAIDWRILVLIGCMIGFGAAMEKSGAASFLSNQMVRYMGQFGPMALLGGFFVLTVLLTQPMSNQAAALVILPVAIQTAQQLHLNPRTFAIMIAVAASCSYLTPLEPACVLVYGPGRYKFTDFFRVGALLTLLIFTIAILLIPRFWPLYAP